MAADINTSISELKTSLDASTAAIASMTTAFNSGILSLVNGLGAIDCSVCPPTGTYPPTAGIDEDDPPPAGFDDYDPVISDRKCKLANMYFDDLHQVTTLLEANGIDDIGALALGSMTALLGLLLGVIATGPVGWGLGALGAIAGVISFFLLESVDLEDLLLILNAEQEDLVCSLYEATTPAGGLVAFKAVLAAGGANAAQLAYFDAVNMVVALEVLFFKPDGSYGDDIETRLDGFVGAIDCSACGGAPSEEGCIFDTAQSSPFSVIVYGSREDPPAWSAGADIYEAPEGWCTLTSRGPGSYQSIIFYVANPVYGHPEWGNGSFDTYWAATKLSFTIQNMATIPGIGNLGYGGINTIVRGPGFSSNAYRASTSGAPELVTWQTFNMGLDPLNEWITVTFVYYYDSSYYPPQGELRDIHLCSLDLPTPWD